MPYSGPDDPDLPAHVRRLSPKKKRQWVAVFNSTFSNCKNPKTPGGQGSAEACEARAIKFANGVVKEEAMADTHPVQCPCGSFVEVEVGAKEFSCAVCETSRLLTWAKKDGDHAVDCGPSVPYHPWGGAVSFAEVDAKREANDLADHVGLQKRIFDGVWENIWDSEDPDLTMEQKAALVSGAVRELVKRIAAGPQQKEESPQPSLLEKIKGALFPTVPEDESVTVPEVDRVGDDAPYWQRMKRIFQVDGPVLREKAWDGDAAEKRVRKWASSDGSGRAGTMNWTKYGRAFAVKTAPGSKFGDFGFIHHDIIGGKFTLDREGVIAAWQAARGARAGAPNTKAQSHLTPHRMALGMEKQEVSGAFFVTKDAKGAPRWVAIVTNKFQDKDGEWFSEAAHREFEEHLLKTKDYPEAWVWHLPGTRFGQADFWAYDDNGFVIASGGFDEGMERAAERLATYPEPLGVSHGFIAKRSNSDPRVYERYRTHELSPLPLPKAANSWTGFGVALKEAFDMGMRPEQQEMLEAIFGSERAVSIGKAVEDLSKQLKQAGVSYKALSSVFDDPAEAGGGGNGNGDDDGDEEEDEGTGEGEGAGEGETAATPATPAPGEQEGAEGASVAGTAEANVSALVGEIAKMIDERLAPIQEQVQALGKSLDERTADALRPKAVAVVGGPANGNGNIIDAKTGAAMTKDGDGDGDGQPTNPARKYVDQYLANPLQ